MMTVTSLFTDMVGSTSFLCQVGAAKQAASHTVPPAAGSVAPMVRFPRQGHDPPRIITDWSISV